MILLRVEWVDSESWAGWHEDVKAGEPLVTYGLKVKEEDGFLYLAHTRNSENEWAGLIAIPVRAIVKKRRIGH